MIERLAQMILDAQRIHEESWDAETKTYMATHACAADEAGETSGLDTRANELVATLNVVIPRDAQAWAKRCLQKPRYEDFCPGCVFLGRYEEYDMYFCIDGGVLVSVSAGHFGRSILPDHAGTPMWKYALARATEQGFTGKEKEDGYVQE